MAINILMLTFFSMIAAYRAKGDLWVITFVVSVYTMLVLLFWCLNASKMVPEDSKAKKTYRVRIWSLGALLNIMFSYKVFTILPLAMAFIIWVAMASLAILTTFYAFFVCKDDNKDNESFCEEFNECC
ncbi:hypothetical protein QJS04_geneDACA021924 [Acorus gramineus]|uniref:Uncharacterized protein n=1 Tax=Acorus gramineus TaxID=55184 RepID=A0AAV9A5E0_ACOGR|nr:hypothetical protein QJS04_geneDACA021924 [Acorus gramineus]